MVYGGIAMPKNASDMQEHTGNPVRPTLKCLSPTVGKETFFFMLGETKAEQKPTEILVPK